MSVPTTDYHKATEFMSQFLQWMDTTYLQARENEVTEFEEGILKDS